VHNVSEKLTESEAYLFIVWSDLAELLCGLCSYATFGHAS